MLLSGFVTTVFHHNAFRRHSCSLVLCFVIIWIVTARSFFTQEDRNCLAVYGEYGGSFNKIVQLYKLAELSSYYDYVVLDDTIPLFYQHGESRQSMWHWASKTIDMDLYAETFNVRHGLTYTSMCNQVHAEDLFFFDLHLDAVPEIWDSLVLRDMEHVSVYNFTFHDRNFEGNCPSFASESYCNLDPSSVTGAVVLSDGQTDKYKDTDKFNGSFIEGVKLMVKSKYHMGPSGSTVDQVVSQWRERANKKTILI